MAALTAGLINGLTGGRLGLTACVITTWMLVAAGSTPPPTNRCYACGPQSSHWYPGVSPPSCDNFTAGPEFEVDCGMSYPYCAMSASHDPYTISRTCAPSLENKCVAKACAKTKSVYTVCTCKGALCNSNLTSDQMKNLKQSEIDKQSTDNTTSQEIEATTVSTTTTETVTEFQRQTEPLETTTLQQEPLETKEQAESENRVPNSVTTTTENVLSTQPPVMIKQESVTGHTLPRPAALGQENNTPKQGAPVDDEEDGTEGSGNHMESENKSEVSPTLAPAMEQGTTTESLKSNARATFNSAACSFVLWTSLTVLMIK